MRFGRDVCARLRLILRVFVDVCIDCSKTFISRMMRSAIGTFQAIYEDVVHCSSILGDPSPNAVSNSYKSAYLHLTHSCQSIEESLKYFLQTKSLSTMLSQHIFKFLQIGTTPSHPPMPKEEGEVKRFRSNQPSNHHPLPTRLQTLVNRHNSISSTYSEGSRRTLKIFLYANLPSSSPNTTP